MTPIADFVIAIIAGWLVPNGRRAAAVVVLPWLVVLAEQTWILASGRGHSPPSTVSHLPQAIGYWLVQVALLAVALSIAWLVGALRAHRPQRPVAAHGIRRQAAIALGLLAAAAAVFVVVGVLTSAPVRHHLANGSPPAIGFIGMALELVTVATLGVATIRRRRAAAQAAISTADPSVTTAARQ
jgi:hypothetical protein